MPTAPNYFYRLCSLQYLSSTIPKELLLKIQLDVSPLTTEDLTNLSSPMNLAITQVSERASGSRVYLVLTLNQLNGLPDEWLSTLQVLEDWLNDGKIKRIAARTNSDQVLTELQYDPSLTPASLLQWLRLGADE